MEPRRTAFWYNLFMGETPNPEMSGEIPYSLPVVSKEAADAMLAEASEEGITAFLDKVNTELDKNNRVLSDLIAQYVRGKGTTDPEAIALAYQVMLLTHELLRRGADSTQLSTTFDLEAPDDPQ